MYREREKKKTHKNIQGSIYSSNEGREGDLKGDQM